MTPVRDPVRWLFWGSLAGGVAAGRQAHVRGHRAPLDGPAHFLGGFLLVDAALLAGLRLEHTSVTRQRFLVDAAEQVTRTRVTLHYGPTAAKVGATLAGLGAGFGLSSA